MIVIGRYTTRWNNQYMDMFLGGKPLPPVPVYYFGLSLKPADGYGSVAEPSRQAGYARVRYPNDADAWEQVEIGYRANTRPIAFPRLRSEWGLVKSMFLCDGVWVLAVADLVTPLSPSPGDDPPTVAPGAFMIGMT